MKKKTILTEEQKELEIIKAVAQAWLSHTTSTTTSPPPSTNEFDTRRLNFKNKPTRFKAEVVNKPSRNNDKNTLLTSWDFNQSLWDAYEIVSVSRKLETGLLLGNEFDESRKGKSSKKRKESKNSLRNILSRTSSRRFDD